MTRTTRAKIRVMGWTTAGSPLIEELREGGYTVLTSDHTEPPSLREIKQSGPLAIVIDLSRRPSYGRSIGLWLRGSKSTRLIPLVFVGGEAATVAALRKTIPDAAYAPLNRVSAAVKKVIANPPPEPVVPRQMMQGYASRTTAQKLGIREDSVVAVIDPPEGYLLVLGKLPAGVAIEEESFGACSVALWFLHDAAEFAAGLSQRRALAARAKLWIIWKKGRRDGLNGNLIREAALQMGLVDYKICSLDSVWSGMAFAVKKTKR